VIIKGTEEKVQIRKKELEKAQPFKTKQRGGQTVEVTVVGWDAKEKTSSPRKEKFGRLKKGKKNGGGEG